MKKIIVIVLSVFLIINFGCKKSNTPGLSFCDYVYNKQFKDTKNIINNYLNTIPESLTSYQKLEKVKDWLATFNCVVDVSIICNGCIDTNPPISELKITFNLDGAVVVKILDIQMSKPLRYYNYHD